MTLIAVLTLLVTQLSCSAIGRSAHSIEDDQPICTDSKTHRKQLAFYVLVGETKVFLCQCRACDLSRASITLNRASLASNVTHIASNKIILTLKFNSVITHGQLEYKNGDTYMNPKRQLIFVRKKLKKADFLNFKCVAHGLKYISASFTFPLKVSSYSARLTTKAKLRVSKSCNDFLDKKRVTLINDGWIPLTGHKENKVELHTSSPLLHDHCYQIKICVKGTQPIQNICRSSSDLLLKMMNPGAVRRIPAHNQIGATSLKLHWRAPPDLNPAVEEMLQYIYTIQFCDDSSLIDNGTVLAALSVTVVNLLPNNCYRASIRPYLRSSDFPYGLSETLDNLYTSEAVPKHPPQLVPGLFQIGPCVNANQSNCTAASVYFLPVDRRLLAAKDTKFRLANNVSSAVTEFKEGCMQQVLLPVQRSAVRFSSTAVSEKGSSNQSAVIWAVNAEKPKVSFGQRKGNNISIKWTMAVDPSSFIIAWKPLTSNKEALQHIKEQCKKNPLLYEQVRGTRRSFTLSSDATQVMVAAVFADNSSSGLQTPLHRILPWKQDGANKTTIIVIIIVISIVVIALIMLVLKMWPQWKKCTEAPRCEAPSLPPEAEIIDLISSMETLNDENDENLFFESNELSNTTNF